MMGKRDLRVATQILTGHAALNHHLSRVNRTVQPLCPLCEAEEETVSHLLGQCPMLLKVSQFIYNKFSKMGSVQRYCTESQKY